MSDFNLKLKHPDKAYAIVIGQDSFTGLQTSRILARRKVPVIAIAGKPDHPCCKTRVCERILSANIGTEEFIQLLEQLGPQLTRKAVLYPCSDMSVFLISENRERLNKWYHIALPEKSVVELLMNKYQFYSFCQQEGFPIPGTFFLHSRSDAEKAAARLNFPCILKPPMKTPLWEKNAEKVYKVENAEAFLKLYQQVCQWADILMIQEWIEGGDDSLYSLNCYFSKDSQPLATFIAKKIRQWPIETGVSALGVECRNDEVLEASVRLFKHVNYQGLGYMEMKRDTRTGKHYMIEPNIGRPTGRSAISEAGGVELLYTKYCEMTGLPLPEKRVQTYQGAKWIYLRRDLQAAYAYWKRGDLTFREWLKSMRGKKYYALFSWTDPMPFIEDILVTFWKKGVKKEERGKVQVGESGTVPMEKKAG
ncbi:MAG: carboxylate--amine ligase [Calditrichaeota bacterium]|nr:carboxylate--amine ligase [Calditrichota bacterium]MCB0295634.1 carboxylate--amine ligase [Calditrichota bacterium]MCB0302543.1 carboxylate--amine ligase [Calditrichota bacterium]MCB0312147.1 carboxylate--amine ligase [Calditrichota bacterium]MCB9090907.1 carboxylate--amine ligase [Calditrichia bacterium]